MEYTSFNVASSIIRQTIDSVDLIFERSKNFHSGDDYRTSPLGMMTLDSICMQFIAIGESMKKFDKITGGKVLSMFPDVPWKQLMGLRDIVAHRYFDVDADEISWIISNELGTIRNRLTDISKYLDNPQ